MTDRHADSRRIAQELSDLLGSPLNFTLKLFLAGAKDIIIPDHVFLHHGRVRGLLRYTMSTSGLSFDSQWPAIDVSQTSESLFSHKAVDMEMNLNQTIARHFNSRMGPAMMFLPLQHDSSSPSSSPNQQHNNDDHHQSHHNNNNNDSEHSITARYYAKESIFDVVGELRASKMSGLLVEYRTPLDGYHNLLRATFTPFLLVMEMRRSKHSLREHQVPLKQRVATSAQSGGMSKEVQVPQSASALVCDMLNALVMKKEETGEFVERCVAYFSVISPRLVTFLWCTQINMMPLEHANQLDEQVTSLQPTQQHQQQIAQQQHAEEEDKKKRQKHQQLLQEKKAALHSKSSSPLDTTITSTPHSGTLKKKFGGSPPRSDVSFSHQNNSSLSSTGIKNRRQAPSSAGNNSTSNVNNANYLEDQSLLSPRLLRDMKLSPIPSSSAGAHHHHHHHHQQQNDDKGETPSKEQQQEAQQTEIVENKGTSINSNNDSGITIHQDEAGKKEYIKQHSIIHQNLPSAYSAMRDEKSFVSSLRRVRENYHSSLCEDQDQTQNYEEEDEDEEHMNHVRELATIAAARKVAKMFGVAKDELPPRPAELSEYRKAARSNEDYSAARSIIQVKKSSAKRKVQDDKYDLALRRAEQRRKHEQDKKKQARQGSGGKKSNNVHSGEFVLDDNDDTNGNHHQNNNISVHDNNTSATDGKKEPEEEDANTMMLPSAAKKVKLLKDDDYDLHLSEIQGPTYERFDCGMSGYIIDMPAHFIFSKYGTPHFDYSAEGGSHANNSGGGNNNNGSSGGGAGGDGDYNNNSGKSLLDQLLQPGSIRYQKRKERQARNAPPLVPVEAGKGYIEQTVSSKLGGHLLSSKLLSSRNNKNNNSPHHRHGSSSPQGKSRNTKFTHQSKSISEMLFANVPKEDDSLEVSFASTTANNNNNKFQNSTTNRSKLSSTGRLHHRNKGKTNISSSSGGGHHDHGDDPNYHSSPAEIDVELYLNSTAASRHRLRKHKLLEAMRRGDEQEQQEIQHEIEEDEDAASQVSSNESEELLQETTGNQTAPGGATAGSNAVMKTVGLDQEESAHLTYTVQKIRSLGEAIFQTAADLLYRACSQQAARRSMVEVVIPFGYRHLDQELRSTLLTLGLEEQPVESMGRIAEFRIQHENDGTSFGELATNNPIGEEAQSSMFDDESYVRQNNGTIASLRDEWYSLDGGGSVVFVLHSAQTAVPRAEKFLQTLEQELTPLAKFDSPLCSPKDIECCRRLCELVAERGFTICDAANVLATERKQRIEEEEKKQFEKRQQQQKKRR